MRHAIVLIVAAYLVWSFGYYLGFRRGVLAAYRRLALERNEIPPFNRKRK